MCEILGHKGRPARKADNLTAICESIVWRKCGSLHVPQSYGASRPVTRIAFLLNCVTLHPSHNVKQPLSCDFLPYFPSLLLATVLLTSPHSLPQFYSLLLTPSCHSSTHSSSLFLATVLLTSPHSFLPQFYSLLLTPSCHSSTHSSSLQLRGQA
jgi:hypothetical protein